MSTIAYPKKQEKHRRRKARQKARKEAGNGKKALESASVECKDNLAVRNTAQYSRLIAKDLVICP